METISGMELFWTAPNNEEILGMFKYQDMIVVATSGGVYVIAPAGRGLMDHEVKKISHDTVRALAD